jgi:SAM-dependent methyltransferase
MAQKLPYTGLAQHYSQGRQGYPDEVIASIVAGLPPNPLILDVGCGTGIGTRQLVSAGATAIGSDIDPELLQAALTTSPAAAYCVAYTEKLPFSDAVFDAITAFGAFHWFMNDESMSEIRRVLKPKGLVAVINKGDTPDGPIAKSRTILATYHHGSYHSKKENYDPVAFLTKHGLTATLQEVDTRELYTRPQFLSTVMSMAPWNHVPEDSRHDAKHDILGLFDELATDGTLVRETRVNLVLGRV